MLDKKTNYFDKFEFDDDYVKLNKLNWLPQKLIDVIKLSINDSDRSLSFNISDMNIELSYIPFDKVTGNYSDVFEIVKVSVTKEQLIMYLAKIFYYFPDVAIMNENEYDDTEEDSENFKSNIQDIYLTYFELLKDPKHVQKSLKEWI